MRSIALTQSKKKTFAEFLPLTEKDWQRYLLHLGYGEEYEPYELAGCIGVQCDLLMRAQHIARVFHRTCKYVFEEMKDDRELHNDVYRALENLPYTRAAIERSPFFLGYMRIDFFPNLRTGELKIVEVNSCGSGLTDYLPCIDFLKQFHSFRTPHGSRLLTKDVMLSCLLDYCRMRCPSFRSMGLVAMENGCTDYLHECSSYGKWLRENTNITPVYLSLHTGELSLLDHPGFPQNVSDLSEIDCIFIDFFEDLQCLERVQAQLDALDVLLVPPRSDILFENKHFLSVLQNMEKPPTIPGKDWMLLKNAILPSSPLEEFESHLEAMRQWDGIVLKMDIDCCGENVQIFDFAKVPIDEAFVRLEQKKRESDQSGITYTVQQFVHPPHIPLNESYPSWANIDYTPYKFDLMTYFCLHEDIPHVLYGSRCFSREKVDELTEEGRQDSLGSPICTI